MAKAFEDDGVERFEAYRPEVYRWALGVLRSHHDALDAVQDVGVRWLIQARRDLPENPRGWLRAVTFRRALDLLRSRSRESVRLRASALPPESQPASGASLLEQGELRARVAEALCRLTEPQRAVLIAKELDGNTFAEIAAELQIAVSTAKTHYLRGLRHVRGLLERGKDERPENQPL